MFSQVLRRNVQERIEGNQLETRSENKMWLVRHLELIRMITMEDLQIVRSLCQPVFPPSYNILDHSIVMVWPHAGDINAERDDFFGVREGVAALPGTAVAQPTP